MRETSSNAWRRIHGAGGVGNVGEGAPRGSGIEIRNFAADKDGGALVSTTTTGPCLVVTLRKRCPPYIRFPEKDFAGVPVFYRLTHSNDFASNAADLASDPTVDEHDAFINENATASKLKQPINFTSVAVSLLTVALIGAVCLRFQRQEPPSPR